MTARVSISLDLPEAVAGRLDRLAETSDRSRTALATEAIGAWLAREERIALALARGAEDIAAGRLVSHDAAMAELDAAIDAVTSKRR